MNRVSKTVLALFTSFLIGESLLSLQFTSSYNFNFLISRHLCEKFCHFFDKVKLRSLKYELNFQNRPILRHRTVYIEHDQIFIHAPTLARCTLAESLKELATAISLVEEQASAELCTRSGHISSLEVAAS